MQYSFDKIFLFFPIPLITDRRSCLIYFHTYHIINIEKTAGTFTDHLQGTGQIRYIFQQVHAEQNQIFRVLELCLLVNDLVIFVLLTVQVALAGQFHTRIELRQIGVRDESKMLGGLGVCGQPFCCSRFLKNFQPVSIKMAKEQGLSLNPAKISGSCGRLMCCLAYEQKSYEYLNSITPQVGSIVRTPDGEGTVIEVNVVADTLKVRSNVEILAPRIYKRDECVYVRGGKRTPLPADKEDK